MGFQATIASASRIEKTVCAVVISYLPDRNILDNARALTSQLKRVVVVDNTPRLQCSCVLDDLELLRGCAVIRNGKNVGIAAALNIGIRHAISLGYDWIAIFDQDSKICDGYFEEMFATYRQAKNPESIGILYPRYRIARLGIYFQLPKDSDGQTVMCMTSGSVMKSETFLSVGQMEEDLFIDYVDYEYCMRMRSAGLHILESSCAILDHSLGRMTKKKVFGREMLTTNHSARRRYYINRNRLVLIRRYMFKYPSWSFRELKGLIFDGIKVFFLEPDRCPKVGYFFQAILDGMLGRLGPRVAL